MVNIRRVNHPSFNFLPVTALMASQIAAMILAARVCYMCLLISTKTCQSNGPMTIQNLPQKKRATPEIAVARIDGCNKGTRPTRIR